jgi:protein SCO1/2
MGSLDSIDPEVHKKINKVFISVDNKRDDKDKVDEYSRYFATDFIGLTGEKKEIERVTKNYGVHFSFVELKDSKLGYTVDHTSRFFILNKQGKLVASFTDVKNDPDFKKTLIEVL